VGQDSGRSAPKAQKKSSEQTIYKGILKLGASRFQVQPFGKYLGIGATLEAALQMALKHYPLLCREDMMRQPSLCAGAASTDMGSDSHRPTRPPAPPTSLGSVRSPRSTGSGTTIKAPLNSSSSLCSVGSAGAISAVQATAVRRASTTDGPGGKRPRTSAAEPAPTSPVRVAASSPRKRKRLRNIADVDAHADVDCAWDSVSIGNLSADQFREFFMCLWDVYREPSDEFLPSDLSDMVARLQGPSCDTQASTYLLALALV
jgi:hypothetical protein